MFAERHGQLVVNAAGFIDADGGVAGIALETDAGTVLVGLKLRLQLLPRNLPPEQSQAKVQLDELREQVTR